jgi:hypothetical protein
MANPGLLLKGAKMLSKTPAGKKAKKKVLDAVKRKRNFTDQMSTSNSTVRDRLTKAMKTTSSIMSTSEAAKAAAVSATAGYLLGKKKKK